MFLCTLYVLSVYRKQFMDTFLLRLTHNSHKQSREQQMKLGIYPVMLTRPRGTKTRPSRALGGKEGLHRGLQGQGFGLQGQGRRRTARISQQDIGF